MSTATPHPDNELPTLPDDVQDELFAILLGDRTRRDAGLAGLRAKAAGHARAIAAHVAYHDALRQQGRPATPTGNAARAGRPAGDGTPDDADRPQQIGPYRILGTLGEGGMGTVYLAEQQEPVKLRVALKLIKLGMDSREVVARFEHERNTLAMMQHDSIAKVFNCGTSDRGQPYFVMELVRGTPLSHFCEQEQLSLTQRIVLVQQVCAAVQHAHQKGVVHRDLKPSNVLVCNDEGGLRVKIIDFGLAKAMGHLRVGSYLQTEAGQVVGTPEYMAPEQADPTNHDIDTRADIYSLGVMLYELLVGALPFSCQELRRAGMLEVQRILRETDPPKPSTRLKSSPATAAAVAAARRMSPSALLKALEQDLNWVTLKALEKDRNRRYESASALAADLQRFIDHEPVLAGPPSAAYRIRKLMRRHRRHVAAAAAIVIALVAGGVATFVQYLRAEEKAAEAFAQKGEAELQQRVATQRAAESAQLAKEKSDLAAAEAEARRDSQRKAAEAEQRTRELEQVLAFQEAQWRGVDSELMGAHLRGHLLASATAARRDALAADLVGVNFTNLALDLLRENLFTRSLTAIGAGFANQPQVKARLLQSVAHNLSDLGLLEAALAPQTEALAIRRGAGADLPETLHSIVAMGNLRAARGDLAEGERLCREAVAMSQQAFGNEHRHTLLAQGSLATVIMAQGRTAEAEALLGDVQATCRRVLGPDDPDTHTAINNLGVFLQVHGRLAEAEPYARESMEASRRILGEGHPETLASIHNYAVLLNGLCRFAEAEPLLGAGLAKCRSVLGDDHPSTLLAINAMGVTLQDQGRLTDAEPYFREAWERGRRVLGETHHETLTWASNMGSLLRSLGRLTEAEPFHREVLETSRRFLGDDHEDTVHAIQEMGKLRRAQGRLTEAEACYRETLATRRRVFGDDNLLTLTSANNMGDLLAAQGKLNEAEAVFRDVLERRRRILAADHTDVLGAVNNLGFVLQAQGRLTEAEPYYRETLLAKRRTLGDDHPRTLTSIVNLGSLLLAQDKLPEAELLLREAVERSRRTLGNDHATTLHATNHLARLLVKTERYDEALALASAAEPAARRTFVDGNVGGLATLLRTLGEAHLGQGQLQGLAAAETLLLEAHTICVTLRGPAHRDTDNCVQTMVRIHETWHRAAPADGHDRQAMEWRAKLQTGQQAAPK